MSSGVVVSLVISCSDWLMLMLCKVPPDAPMTPLHLSPCSSLTTSSTLSPTQSSSVWAVTASLTASTYQPSSISSRSTSPAPAQPWTSLSTSLTFSSPANKVKLNTKSWIKHRTYWKELFWLCRHEPIFIIHY